MTSRLHKLTVRIRLALAQNRFALGFVVVWLAASFLFFSRHLAAVDALLLVLCIDKAHGGLAGGYQSFTEVVVFGVVASLVVTNVTRKYRPEDTCRALAREARRHVVVIGYSNLGKRVLDLTKGVLVEEDASLVKDLVDREEALVIGSPREKSVLETAGVAHARVVVIAAEDLETAAVACRLVRELNAECELVVRFSDDDVGAVLARTYRARSVSTSRLAADFIQQHAVKLRAKAAVVLGKNRVGERVTEALAHKRIAVTHCEADDFTAVAQADFIVVCEDDLGDNLVRVDRIRDLNKRGRIVCRAFHEEAAEILTRAPFDCVVFSTSRHAADNLARFGAFREVGIEDAPKRALAPTT